MTQENNPAFAGSESVSSAKVHTVTTKLPSIEMDITLIVNAIVGEKAATVIESFSVGGIVVPVLPQNNRQASTIDVSGDVMNDMTVGIAAGMNITGLRRDATAGSPVEGKPTREGAACAGAMKAEEAIRAEAIRDLSI